MEAGEAAPTKRPILRRPWGGVAETDGVAGTAAEAPAGLVQPFEVATEDGVVQLGGVARVGFEEEAAGEEVTGVFAEWGVADDGPVDGDGAVAGVGHALREQVAAVGVAVGEGAGELLEGGVRRASVVRGVDEARVEVG